MQTLIQSTHTVVPKPVRCKSQRSKSVSDQEDVLMMQHIATGDSLAFDRFYQRYVPRVKSYLKRRLAQAELIEEVCQDVMFVVWQQASQFDVSKRPSTWVLGIARNKALMCLRTQATHATQLVPTSPDHPDENPEKLLTRWENQAQVHRALAILTPAERDLIRQVYEQERPYREIAASIGCPVNTLKARIRRLRQRLLPTLIALEAESKGSAQSLRRTMAA